MFIIIFCIEKQSWNIFLFRFCRNFIILRFSSRFRRFLVGILIVIVSRESTETDGRFKNDNFNRFENCLFIHLFIF